MVLQQIQMIVTSAVAILAVVGSIFALIRSLTRAFDQLSGLRSEMEKLTTALDRIANNHQDILVRQAQLQSGLDANRDLVEDLCSRLERLENHQLARRT